MTFEDAVRRVAYVICYEGEEAGVEAARGLALTEEDAYLQLRNESRRLRKPMKDLADAIIFTEDLNKRNTAPE